LRYINTVAVAALTVLTITNANAGQCRAAGYELKEPVVCSKSFHFSGTCGSNPYPEEWGWGDVKIVAGAWEKSPIRFLSVSSDALLTGSHSVVSGVMFVGNSWNDDEMTPTVRAGGVATGKIETVLVPIRAEQRFAPGFGMQFPAGQDWHHVHIDVHLSCLPADAVYEGTLTVWYSIDPDLKSRNLPNLRSETR
jgi:hypothetical protein